MQKCLLACIVVLVLSPAKTLWAQETHANAAITHSWGLIDGGNPTTGMISDDLPLNHAIVQPEVVSGSFVLPGSNIVFRLHHTAGNQLGLYPSFTSFGGTRVLPMTGGVWFIDGQLIVDNHARLGGSIDSMWRWMNNDTVWGFGLGLDLTSTEQQSIPQGVLSLEMLRQKWGLRANAYIPFDTDATNSSEFSTSFGLQGTGFSKFTTERLFRESGMSGVDLEVHRNLGQSNAELFAGLYSFEGQNNQAAGYRLGIRGNVTDDIEANLLLTQDSEFDTRLSAGLTWFFGPGQRSRRTSDRRLHSLVRRNHYVSVDRQQVATTTAEAVTDSLSGDPLHVLFASEGGSGSGTQQSPTSIAAALANPNFGAGSVLVLLDQGGDLTTSISLSADRQQVIGGPSGSVTIDLSDTSSQPGALLTLTNLGGAPVLTPTSGLAAIRLSSSGVGHVIRGLTLDGSGGIADGIRDFDGTSLTFGATNTLIQQMLIRDFAGTGVLIQPSINTTIENTIFQNNGQDVSLNATNTTLRNIFSTGSLGNSISLANTTGTTTIDNVAVANSSGTGLTLSNASGQVNINNLDVIGSGDAGVDLQGGDATVTFDNLSSIANSGGAAFQVQGGSTDVSFQGTISQGSTGAAVSVDGSHDGSLAFNQASVSATQGTGLRFQDADGDYHFGQAVSLSGGASVFARNLSGELTFADLFIDGSVSHGVFLDDHAGLFSIAGRLNITGAGGFAAVAVHDAAAGSSANFGTTSISATGAGTLGIDLNNNQANALFTFRDMSLATADATGLMTNQGGIVNFVGTPAEITANGGSAVDLTSTMGQHDGMGGWIFSQLTSTNSTNQGLRLADLADNFQVVGTTSITNATGIGLQASSIAGNITLTSLSIDGATTGLDLFDHSGTFMVTGIESVAGSGGQIQNVNLGARLENVADATLRNLTVNAATRGIEGSVTGGNNSSIVVRDSVINAEGDAGVRIESSSGSTGQLTTILWNNQIESQGAAVDASAAGGDINLTLSENDLRSPTGTGLTTNQSGGGTITQTMFENGWTSGSDPLLTAGVLGADGKRELLIADPDVVYDSSTGTWHLYYFAARGSSFVNSPDEELYIQHATSSNGTNWVLDAGHALSLPHDSNAWDSIRVETPSVVIDPLAAADRRFKLYYSGAHEMTVNKSSNFPIYQLGLAFSADGSTFSRLSAAESPYGEEGAVLRVGEVLGNMAGFDTGVLADPEVHLIDGTYNMWFSSFAENSDGQTLAFGISHATSVDGIHWTPGIGNPVPSLAWSQNYGGQQPSIAYNSALHRWETYFTSDTEDDKSSIPSKFNPSAGAWRSTSLDHLNWSLEHSGRDFNWDSTNPYEELGLLTGIEVVIVDDVRHLFYTGWGSVDPPPGFVVPIGDNQYAPAVLSLLHATKSAFED